MANNNYIKAKKVVKKTSNPKNKKNTKAKKDLKKDVLELIKKNKRGVIVVTIILVLLLLFIIITGAHNNNNKNVINDGLKYNENDSFTKKQKISGIAFKDIKCTYDGRNSLISYTMKNTTRKEIYLSNYIVYVKNKDKQTISKIVVKSEQKFTPKEEVSMANQVVGVDLTDAYYMELELDTNNN